MCKATISCLQKVLPVVDVAEIFVICFKAGASTSMMQTSTTTAMDTTAPGSYAGAQPDGSGLTPIQSQVGKK